MSDARRDLHVQGQVQGLSADVSDGVATRGNWTQCPPLLMPFAFKLKRS